MTMIRGSSACSSTTISAMVFREGASMPSIGSSSMVSGARAASARQANPELTEPRLCTDERGSTPKRPIIASKRV